MNGNNLSRIKVSELFFFFSIQGEGRYQGVPSVFLRTFGCNFTCGGFGMPKGQLSEERNKIDPKSFNSYEDLPLVTTGCDSYASWDPRFKHLSPSRDIDSLVSDIVELLPFKEWREEHLVITGGEPLLGWQRAYTNLLSHEKMKALKELTFETNGTQKVNPTLEAFLKEWGGEYDFREVTFSVSPKLTVSGHTTAEAIKPEVVKQYQSIGYTYLKFVIASEEDANEALEATKMYKEAGFTGPVYFMPVGGVEEVYKLNNQNVAELAMKHGVRYSDRLHIPLWGNAWNR